MPRLLLTLILTWITACAPAGRAPVGPATGSMSPGRLEIVDFESRVFGNTRKLRIWLPSGYDDPGNRDHSYPVLYLNDGQNLFDGGTAAFGREWKADETATELQRTGRAQAVVIVGIDNTGRQRAREYLPWPDDSYSPPEPDPQGRHYAQFLSNEVLPFVEQRYRVARQREGRALGGSSYGALITMHVALTRPELFSRFLLESPSFYVDSAHILRDARAARLTMDRVFLGVGTNELARPDCGEHPDNVEAVNNVRELVAILARAGLREEERTMLVVEQCAVHNEDAWAGRFPAALAFLFPGRSP
jgi:predicted alpha/beta superfamily hydrolase